MIRITNLYRNVGLGVGDDLAFNGIGIDIDLEMSIKYMDPGVHLAWHCTPESRV